MSLVNVPTRGLDPSELAYLTGLVILTQVKGNRPVALGADRSTVANVDNIEVVVVSHYKVATTS